MKEYRTLQNRKGFISRTRFPYFWWPRQSSRKDSLLTQESLPGYVEAAREGLPGYVEAAREILSGYAQAARESLPAYVHSSSNQGDDVVVGQLGTHLQWGRLP